MTLWYETLTIQQRQCPMAAASWDCPLLGFSLIVIAMEDADEFDVRVRQRITDPNDVQPEEATLPGRTDCPHFLSISRGSQQPRHANAHASTRDARRLAQSPPHGAFARAGENRILIEFK